VDLNLIRFKDGRVKYFKGQNHLVSGFFWGNRIHSSFKRLPCTHKYKIVNLKKKGNAMSTLFKGMELDFRGKFHDKRLAKRGLQ